MWPQETPPSLHATASQTSSYWQPQSAPRSEVVPTEMAAQTPMGGTQSASTLLPASGQPSSMMWPQETPSSLRATASQTSSYWQPQSAPRSEIVPTEMAAQTPMGGTKSTSTLLPVSGQPSSMIPSETVPSFHDTAHQTLTCSRSPSEYLSPPILSPHFEDMSPQPSTSFHSATSRSPTSAQSPLKCTSSTSFFPPARYSILPLAEMKPRFSLTEPQPSTSLPSSSRPRSVLVHPTLSPTDFSVATQPTQADLASSSQCFESHSTEMQSQVSATASQNATNSRLLSKATSMQTMPTTQPLKPQHVYSEDSLPSTSRSNQKSQNAEIQLRLLNMYLSEPCRPNLEAGTCPGGQSCPFAKHGSNTRSPSDQLDFRKLRCIDFEFTGSCEAGDRCPFRHVIPEHSDDADSQSS
ncbi:unnamed protein product [Mesocestoides corti]|uniref:C3H1-type domain-containing protein n=1 Tax=Mesocestoides corti TaxID=53468 RepID=A0A0R3UCS5_MESCO|nr:unnamed protein product [Mesocestoides corti]